MKRDTDSQRIYAVSDIQGARAAVFEAEKGSLKSFPGRVVVRAITYSANIILAAMRRMFFDCGAAGNFEAKNIVVYTVGIVGDNVVMLPALAAIRNRYPEAFITVISNCQLWESSGVLETLGPSRFKDRLIVISDYPVERRGFQLVFNRHLFPDVECDLFIDLSPFGNRGWIGAVIKEVIFARRLGARRAVGFHVSSYSRKRWFDRIKHYFVQNEPRRSRRALGELGITPLEDADLFEHVPAAKESVLDKLRAGGWDDRPLFVINPGAKFRSKCWPAPRFAQIAEHIAEIYGGCPVITGVESERDIAEEVKAHSSCGVINLCGMTTIQELVELLRLAGGCVTNDTGTMHISAMTNTPTVAIFSMRHSPTHWFPLGHRIVALFAMPACRYCYDDACEETDCLKMIETEHVKMALKEALAKA
jgi:heptosyltransferase III